MTLPLFSVRLRELIYRCLFFTFLLLLFQITTGLAASTGPVTATCNVINTERGAWHTKNSTQVFVWLIAFRSHFIGTVKPKCARCPEHENKKNAPAQTLLWIFRVRLRHCRLSLSLLLLCVLYFLRVLCSVDVGVMVLYGVAGCIWFFVHLCYVVSSVLAIAQRPHYVAVAVFPVVCIIYVYLCVHLNCCIGMCFSSERASECVLVFV